MGRITPSALSPVLFAMVMDRPTVKVRLESPCTVMFPDDIVICDESREEYWRYKMKIRGMEVCGQITCVWIEGDRKVRMEGVFKAMDNTQER